MNHLFIFTIGPVQPFIESSRKGIDMYAGSKLLSEMMEYAIEWLKKKAEMDIIFPKTERLPQEGVSNIPNRLIAKTSDKVEQELSQLAENLTDEVQRYFLERCLTLIRGIGIPENQLEKARKQCQDFLEIYWCFEQYEEGEYRQAYQTLFSNINAVKNIRRFVQINEPWGRKCELFPQYNAIFAKKNEKGSYPWKVNPNYVYDITDFDSLKCRVKTGEALSAPALIKRLYGEPEMKVYSIRRMLMESRIDPEWTKELEISAGDGTANALYELANNQRPDPEECDSKEISDAEKLWKFIRFNRDVKLAYYYALLKFDGDDMGQNFLKCDTAEEQQKLSQSIGVFAKKVPGIIKEYKGLTIFTGGEDFFGILPLDTLFECLGKLHSEFKEIVKLDFSAGIAVAHVMQPLKHVISMVNQMEQAAKSGGGEDNKKNAFVIGILKRSGERVETPAYKLDDTQGFASLSDMEKLLNNLKEKNYSKALMFRMSQVLQYFERENIRPDVKMAEIIIQKEAASIGLEKNETIPENLIYELVQLYEKCNGVSQFLSTLNALVFLAGEVR